MPHESVSHIVGDQLLATDAVTYTDDAATQATSAATVPSPVPEPVLSPSAGRSTLVKFFTWT